MMSGEWRTKSVRRTYETMDEPGWFERVVLRGKPRSALVTVEAHLDYVLVEGSPPELVIDDEGRPTMRFTAGSNIFVRGIQMYEIDRKRL